MATVTGEGEVSAPAATPAATEYPPPRQAWYAVGVLALATTFAMLDQGILGLLIQQIIVDFDLTDTEASLPAALAVTWLGWRTYREAVERLDAQDAAEA